MPLIISSGYGSNQHISTSGYAEGLLVSYLFSLESVELPTPSRVRARFNREPNTTIGGSSSRGNVVANWTLTGPSGNVPIQIASVFVGDNEVIDLGLFGDLVPGNYTLSVVTTVESSDIPPYTIDQNSVAFVLTEVAQDPISLGASGSTSLIGLPDSDSDYSGCIDLVNRLFNPGYRNKTGWSALVAGIARGDCIVSTQAKNSFDQFFVSTAIERYLAKRGADYGISKPLKTGMPDDSYRNLIINSVSSKLNQDAFLKVLKIFYGLDAVTGFSQTVNFEPFILFEGAQLRLLIDEKYDVEVVFNRQDFSILRRATAEEVAAVITRALSVSNAGGFAAPHRDSVTGKYSVRIYSGSMGLTSSVRVTNGTSQIALQFPSNRLPLQSPPPSAPSWTITILPNGRARYSCNPSTMYDFSKVQVDDYIVILGQEYNPGNRGAFKIEFVNYSYNGSTLQQWVEVANRNAVNQVITQIEYSSVNFFEPRKLTQYEYPGHSIVSQINGKALVSIPATTLVVSRKNLEAAYLNQNTSIPFSSLSRNPDGKTTIVTGSAHLLNPGDSFIVDGFVPQLSSPPSGSQSNSGTYSTYNEASGRSWLSSVSKLAFGFTYEGTYFKNVIDVDNDLWCIGGVLLANNGTVTAKNTASIFSLVSETEDSDKRRQHSYKWYTGTVAAEYNLGTAVSIPESGAVLKPYLIGGYHNTPWGDTTANPAVVAAVAVATKIKPKEEVLSLLQLSDTEGVLAATPIWFSSNPLSGHLLTVTDGVTTRTYGFGAGGDVTVTIGGTVAATRSNLTASINGDGGAAWGATDAISLEDFPTTGAVVIHEDSVIASKSGLRIFGDAGLATLALTVNYADNSVTRPSYLGAVAISLPAANPGGGRAGFHRVLLSVATDDTHEVLNGAGNIFRRWVGTWSLAMNWVATALTGGTLVTPVAEASAISLGATILATGGVTIFNKASTSIQQKIGAGAWTSAFSLQFARCNHTTIKISNSQALVIGGRQPANDFRRTALGYSGWDFEDAHGAVEYAGPVNVTVAGNARLAGKIGYGTNLTNPCVSVGGAGQTTLNATLLGAYTISGWMTSGNGCVLRNGTNSVSVLEANNALISFGVDINDGRFYVRWMHGAGIEIEKKTTATMASLMPIFLSSPYPVYYHFAITKTYFAPAPTATFTLYINGVVAGSWTDTAPSGGTNGVWALGQTDVMIPTARYTQCVDQIGITSTILTAQQVWEQYLDEVGVVHENPSHADGSAIGKPLNSCELVPISGNAVLTGPMATARFSFGSVKLPDGRVIVAGGCGFNTTNDFKHSSSQRQTELKSVEIWNPDLGVWAPLPDMNDPHSHCAMGYSAAEHKVYISGGFSSKKVEVLNLTTMRWETGKASGDWGLELKAHTGGGLVGNTLVIPGGSVVNIEGNYPLYETTTPHHYSVSLAGEKITGGGINEQNIAQSGTFGSTIVFNTPNHKFWTTTAIAGGTVTKVGASAAVEIAGPFVYDQFGFTVTNISATVNMKMEVGHTYGLVDVGAGQAAAFPNTPAFVVFNFGRADQVGPVKYLGKISNSTIVLDSVFKFGKVVKVGDSVRFVTARQAFAPGDSSEIGAFWLTASSAGRSGAINTIKGISAFGIPLEITVRYPGDRGLGGQGRPVKNSYKLSDIVAVFSGDNVDFEIEESRNG